MTYEQQLAAIKATIAAKQKELGGVMTKSASEKRTLNDQEEAQAKAVEGDIAKLEKNAERVERLIAAQQKAVADDATPVAGETAEESQATADGAQDPVKTAKKVSVKSNLDEGIGFAKAMRARVLSQKEFKAGNAVSALDIAKSRNEPEQVIQYLEKATVGRTTESTMEALVDPANLAGEFVELLRARTVFDKLTGFRNVPFNTRMANQLTGGIAEWVGEGAKKPVTNPTFGSIKIDEHKLAAISIFTDEFLRNSSPKADSVFLEDLLAACATLIDTTFLSSQAGDQTTPGGVLNGVTGIKSTGKTPEAYKADLRALITKFLVANKSLAGSQLIMSEVLAYELADMSDALGNEMFKGMDSAIGAKAFKGINVIESEAAVDKIVLIKPSEILLADDGRVEVSYSDQATLDNGGTPINLWQENMNAIRVERFITWAKRRADAVAYLDLSAG